MEDDAVWKPSQMNTSSILTLTTPWPPGLGRVSPSAARAVREAGPNATVVTFPASAESLRGLLALPGRRVSIEAPDAAAYYATRARDDDLVSGAGRRLAGRYGPGQPAEEPLHGSMGGYFTCA